ncbi:hypothetical protein [Aequorivita echinoideorum]|uniref:GLPGLI family protein n=1 Tax=Aequorivita echinoideorum TaxID=1549647 RepID=A0ABS5S6Y4_9FLAO|nr:hypothetical protein [Aequorivita echinoideorum]MBT0608962.1 hypothetical protein [Aequorivita echinoideorum]
MKKWLFIALLLPVFVSAQSDFETRFLRINATTLPEIEDLTTYSLISTSKFSEKVPSFKMTRENYRKEVNMLEAMTNNQQYIASDIEIKLNPQEYGVFGSGSYPADGSTAVPNVAYKEAQRGLLVTDSCPPFGICPRCAPSRIGNGSFGFRGGRY